MTLNKYLFIFISISLLAQEGEFDTWSAYSTPSSQPTTPISPNPIVSDEESDEDLTAWRGEQESASEEDEALEADEDLAEQTLRTSGLRGLKRAASEEPDLVQAFSGLATGAAQQEPRLTKKAKITPKAPSDTQPGDSEESGMQ